MAQEMTGWRRYAVVTGGMILAGAICAPAAGFTVSPTGTPGPTVLQAESPVAAGIVVLLCFGLTTALAAGVGRLVNAVVGLFVLGAGVSVLAIRWGTVGDLAFAGGAIAPLALETLLWGGLLAAASFAVFRVAGPVSDFGEGTEAEDLVGRWGLRAVGASVVVLPAVWLIARSELKGQTLAAVTGGAMAAGLLAKTLSPQTQPRLLFAAPCLFGAVGYLVAAAMIEGPLAEAFVDWTIPPLALPMPVDYAAGSLMGVALGLGWARSFQHETHVEGRPPGATGQETA